MIHHYGSDDNLQKMKRSNIEEDEEEATKLIPKFTQNLFENLDHVGFPEMNMMNEEIEMENKAPSMFDKLNNGNNKNISENQVMVSEELNNIFAQFESYQPAGLELTPHFRPFLPDLIPSIGIVDAFIKVQRPDNRVDNLGMTTLDEPTIGQVDPQILKMELREKFGVVGLNEKKVDPSYIGYLKQSEMENNKAIDSYLAAIDDIHRNRPPPSISYSSKMPDFEDLMAVWPNEFEEALKSLPLPSADMDLTVDEYARVVCAILEIPVKGNMVESLHHLFSLFDIFQKNVYFISKDDSKQ